MTKISSFDEASSYLAKFYENQQAIYSLDNMRQLMAFLDNPQEKYRVVHVAGTSGKTSTCYFVSAMISASGFKTGLTVSPHVDYMNERLQINGQPLPEADFCAELSEFLELIEDAPVKPSWFEAMVALAFWYFAKVRVDYAVMEVGLGGLVDGTNVIARPDKVCVITDIGLDHTKILGNTLGEIAYQKAGIMQSGNTVFVYRQGPEVMGVIEKVAKDKGSDLRIIEPLQTSLSSNLPAFQQRNSYLARQASDFVLARDHSTKLSNEQLAEALNVYIPGRMETIEIAGKTLVIDGAHNAQKIEAFLSSLRTKYPDKSMAILVAFMEGDEDRLRGALSTIAQYQKRIFVTSFEASQDYHKFSVSPEDVADAGAQLGLDVKQVPNTAEAFKTLLSQPEELLVITGSFYLLNQIRPLMLKA